MWVLMNVSVSSITSNIALREIWTLPCRSFSGMISDRWNFTFKSSARSTAMWLNSCCSCKTLINFSVPHPHTKHASHLKKTIGKLKNQFCYVVQLEISVRYIDRYSRLSITSEIAPPIPSTTLTNDATFFILSRSTYLVASTLLTSSPKSSTKFSRYTVDQTGQYMYTFYFGLHIDRFCN